MSLPKFKIVCPLSHSSIYPDGKWCIWILHAPGEDEASSEFALVLELMPLVSGKLITPATGFLGRLVTILLLLDDTDKEHRYRIDTHGVTKLADPGFDG